MTSTDQQTQAADNNGLKKKEKGELDPTKLYAYHKINDEQCQNNHQISSLAFAEAYIYKEMRYHTINI